MPMPGDSASAVPSPRTLFGSAENRRPARFHEAVAYLQRLARSSDRAVLTEYGTTCGGRALLCLTISSPANLARLDEIQSALRSLADDSPSHTKASAVISGLPAVAWMGYGIHGDEVSGTDAALELAYELCIARDDEATRRLLEKLIIHVDAMPNPDGRERFLTHAVAFSRNCAVDDAQDLLHTQFWPEGRGNHYLFDLNRDAIFSVQRESQFRVRAIRRARPQLYVDAHEMALDDTFLFAVPAQPLNPHLPQAVHGSWAELAADHAAAFDAQGHSFYTRSWNEVFYPGFFDIWPAYHGAVPMLYEQAGTSGAAVTLPNGRRRTYAEAVANQLRSSFANLETAARSRVDLLERWFASQQPHEGPARTWFVLPRDPYKTRRIVTLLQAQGVRIERLATPIEAAQLHTVWQSAPERVTLPAGTLLVREAQPRSALIRNIFDFQVALDDAFLKRERRSLDLGGKTRLFDVTAWSLPLAFGADVRWAREAPAGDWRTMDEPLVDTTARAATREHLPTSRYGYVYQDPGLHLTARLLARGVRVRTALESFVHAGVRCDAGSFLIRHDDQTADRMQELLDAGGEHPDVQLVPVDSARIHDGPDLGGQEFQLLVPPRIAVLTGVLADAPATGAVWHLLDVEMSTPATLLDLARLRSFDLSAYSVLVLGDTSDHDELVAVLKHRRLEQLGQWVSSGGTLIALGRAAHALADAGLVTTRSRQAVIDEHPPPIFGRSPAQVVASDFASCGNTRMEAVTGADVTPVVIGAAARDFMPAAASVFELTNNVTKLDDWFAQSPGAPSGRRQFCKRITRYLPRGAYVRADLRPHHWLRYGVTDQLPVLFRESDVLIAGESAEIVGRYAAPADLALSGLIWPEAVGYIAGATYIAREALGAGQVILFGNDPVFRGYSLGTQRLFLNAVFLGPGFRRSAIG